MSYSLALDRTNLGPLGPENSIAVKVALVEIPKAEAKLCSLEERTCMASFKALQLQDATKCSHPFDTPRNVALG